MDREAGAGSKGERAEVTGHWKQLQVPLRPLTKTPNFLALKRRLGIAGVGGAGGHEAGSGSPHRAGARRDGRGHEVERVRRTAQALRRREGHEVERVRRTAQAHDAAGNQRRSGLGAVRRRRTRHAAEGRRARMAAEERVLPVLLVPVSAEARGRLGPQAQLHREQAALGGDGFRQPSRAPLGAGRPGEGRLPAGRLFSAVRAAAGPRR